VGPTAPKASLGRGGSVGPAHGEGEAVRRPSDRGRNRGLAATGLPVTDNGRWWWAGQVAVGARAWHMGAQRAAASDGRSGRCSRGRRERVAATADVQRRACGGAGSSTCSARARACDAAEQSGSGERCGDWIAKVAASSTQWPRAAVGRGAGVAASARIAPVWSRGGARRRFGEKGLAGAAVAGRVGLASGSSPRGKEKGLIDFFIHFLMNAEIEIKS
jgi:hypothetical protein